KHIEKGRSSTVISPREREKIGSDIRVLFVLYGTTTLRVQRQNQGGCHRAEGLSEPRLDTFSSKVWNALCDTLSGQQADVRCQMLLLTSCASSASVVSVLFKRRATQEGHAWTLDFSPRGMPCTSETKCPGTLRIAAGSSRRQRPTPRTGKRCKRWRIWGGITSGWAAAISPPRGAWTRSPSCCQRPLPAAPNGLRL